MKFTLSFNTKVLLICISVSLFLIAIGIFSSDPGVFGHTIILSTFIIATPQFLVRYDKYRKLKEMESKFPTFLRDMVESLRSGVPFHKSILACSNVDYGRLSKEVKKMANQISWGMPFGKVIDQFADRVSESRRLNIGLGMIKESYISGGDVVSTLESVADTAEILDDSEKERKSLLSQYTVLMYGICFMFLGIVVAINNLMVPIFDISAMPGAEEALGLANPCDSCMGFSCSVCDLFKGVCSIFAIDTTSIACYYTSLFFFMSTIEAICCGLVAGQISENSITAGLKHSMIMTAVIFGTFTILIRIGLIGA